MWCFKMTTPKLYYCNTHYDCHPPVDINPLILSRHSQSKILALCAREGMVKRISKQDRLPYSQFPSATIHAVGWWDMQKVGLVTPQGYLATDQLLCYDVIVIVGRNRIDSIFSKLLKAVEGNLPCSMLMRSA